MQLSGGQLPATARRSRTLNFLSAGMKIVTNLAGTCSDVGYLKCTRITKRPVETGRFVLEKSRADRFEPLNAIVQWTIARWVGPQRFLENLTASKILYQIWPVPAPMTDI